MSEIIPESVSDVGDREPVLFHYTSFFGLAGMVSSKSLWCSRIHYLNDSRELKEGFRVLENVCGKYAKLLDLPSKLVDTFRRLDKVNVHVCSFTDAGNILSQWRGYAGGSGVSVSFSFRNLQALSKKHGFMLEKCIYAESEKREAAEHFVEQYINSPKKIFQSPEDQAFNLASKFLAVAARFKPHSFSEEREWRLISPPISIGRGAIKVRATNTGLIPYIEFKLNTGVQPLLSDIQPWRTNEDICIRSVMVGPNREQELQVDAIGDLFDSHKAYINYVSRSEIPFRLL